MNQLTLVVKLSYWHFSVILIEKKIVEQFFCCEELKERATGQNIFDTLTNYLGENGLSWKQGVEICTNGALFIIGSIKEFVSFARKENPDIIKIYCFLHREVLIEKTLGSELKKVFDEVVKLSITSKINRLNLV